MNNYIEAAIKLLDLSGAQYFVTHDSLDAPLFGPKKHTKLAVSKPVKTRAKRHRYVQASKWRAMLSDIPRGGSKDLPAPEGVPLGKWQARVAGSCVQLFGTGACSTSRLPETSSVRVSRK